MKLVIQRVSQAGLSVEDKLIAKIGEGLLVFVGFHKEDKEFILDKMLQKFANIHYFGDEKNKTVASIADTNAEILLVSQFTLFADVKKGRNPSWHKAAKPNDAEMFYNLFCEKAEKMFPQKVKKGIFGAYMKINSTNEGPLTLILDSQEIFSSS